MQIKICGITRIQDGELAVELGASMLGFIFWPKSPRFIDPYRARDIVRRLPPSVSPVGVFVNQTLEYMRGVGGLVKLGAVQLHGTEPHEVAREIPYRVIRAVPVTERSEADAIAGHLPDVTLLLDAHDPLLIGGTGRTVNWGVAATVARTRRVILSGGLTAQNVTAAISLVRPWGVDVSSGVEVRPGIKDGARLRAFIDTAREAARLLEVRIP